MESAALLIPKERKLFIRKVIGMGIMCETAVYRGCPWQRAYTRPYPLYTIDIAENFKKCLVFKLWVENKLMYSAYCAHEADIKILTFTPFLRRGHEDTPYYLYFSGIIGNRRRGADPYRALGYRGRLRGGWMCISD